MTKNNKNGTEAARANGSTGWLLGGPAGAGTIACALLIKNFKKHGCTIKSDDGE
jgi:hypothetical protein